MNSYSIIICVAFLSTFVLLQVFAESKVTFYQEKDCNGHIYEIPVNENSEFQYVPKWLHEEGWNMSVRVKGPCVTFYSDEKALNAEYIVEISPETEHEESKCHNLYSYNDDPVHSFKRCLGSEATTNLFLEPTNLPATES